jgi:hypothetical protein
MIGRFSLLALCVATTAQAKTPPATLEAPDAVALADASRGGKIGRFAMTVANTDKIGTIVFLNSTADYRAPDDLSFRISPNVVKTLTRRYGETPETYFRNKRVVVDGTIRREMIVNKDYGRTVGFNRWQHTVRILQASQIVSVD